MNLLPKKGLWQYVISGPNDFMRNEQKQSRIDSTLEASKTGETEIFHQLQYFQYQSSN
jgi:hypothetical protein